jgi:hypothetical protein
MPADGGRWGRIHTRPEYSQTDWILPSRAVVRTPRATATAGRGRRNGGAGNNVADFLSVTWEMWRGLGSCHNNYVDNVRSIVYLFNSLVNSKSEKVEKHKTSIVMITPSRGKVGVKTRKY